MQNRHNGVDVEAVAFFEFGDGTVRDENVRPAEPDVRADCLAESAGKRPVLDRDDLLPLAADTPQRFGIKRLQVACVDDFGSADPRGNGLCLLNLVAGGEDGIGEG